MKSTHSKKIASSLWGLFEGVSSWSLTPSAKATPSMRSERPTAAATASASSSSSRRTTTRAPSAFAGVAMGSVPIVLVGRKYWQQAFNVDFLADEGVIDEEDRELFWYAETAEEIWNSIRQWHVANGTPLFTD